MSGIRWTPEEYEQYIRAIKIETHPSVPPSHVEPNPVDGPTPKNANKEIHPRFRIHVHCKRRRLADPDGIYCKAAVDGIVRGGLLPDDSAKYVESVTVSQELAKTEETIVEVWEIKP